MKHETEQMMDELYSNVHEFFIEDPIVTTLMRKFEARSKVGMKIYGQSMEANKLSTIEWLTHAQEEAMDLALYLQKIIATLDESKDIK